MGVEIYLVHSIILGILIRTSNLSYYYEETIMKTITIVYWQEDDGMWLGHLQNHPDYLTQGETLAELKDNLTDLNRELGAGWIPKLKTVEELVIL
jgi:hypothetical protein